MHRLDNDKQIFFYENEFYCLSNFSSFKLKWKDFDYMTSEHAYHSEKFPDNLEIVKQIQQARSAHDAMYIAWNNKDKYRKDWNEVKIEIMKDVLKAKIEQHPYVKKKLLDSKGKELIEDSWKDDFWGWGENKNGQNNLGKIWMEIRNEI
jgi:ribA/ribD-fused uncharacterized protein